MAELGNRGPIIKAERIDDPREQTDDDSFGRRLAEYTEALFELTGREERSPEDEQAIELLTVLIDRYESENYPVPDAKPSDVLRFLLDQNGLAQRDIAEEMGGESIVSLVLAGKRQLNREHIARLSLRFGVSPAVFFG